MVINDTYLDPRAEKVTKKNSETYYYASRSVLPRTERSLGCKIKFFVTKFSVFREAILFPSIFT